MTPRQIAEWMVEELNRLKYLYQDTVAFEISKRFGEEFTYINSSGNVAIDKKVLKEFRALTPDSVIWDRGERMWRFREDYDQEGRQQT